MTAFLTDDWLASLVADDVDLPDCTVDITVIGAPDGDARWHVEVVAGQLTAEGGGVPGADIALTLPYDDAVKVARGELAASVVFMRGTMKTAGDAGRLLDLLAATARPGFVAARDALASTTTF